MAVVPNNSGWSCTESMSTSNGANLHSARPSSSTLRTKRDFERVYTHGTAHRSELIVLIHNHNDAGSLRSAVVASRRVGGAVQRNRAKRILRVAVRALLSAGVTNSIDVVLVARAGLPQKKSRDVVAAVAELCGRAGIPTSEAAGGV